MKKILFLSLISFVMSSHAGVVTFGDYDCGEWFTKNLGSRTWLLGYMSGINFALANEKRDPLDAINSANQMYLWMENYCRANPLKKVSDGGAELYIELLKKYSK